MAPAAGVAPYAPAAGVSSHLLRFFSAAAAAPTPRSCRARRQAYQQQTVSDHAANPDILAVVKQQHVTRGYRLAAGCWYALPAASSSACDPQTTEITVRIQTILPEA